MVTSVAKLKPVSTPPTHQREAIMHILHVDDELGLLKTTKQILETVGPFQVETASSVKEAMKKLEETDFDVIVSDYQMPEKDGLEFLEELREKGDHIPFILFTGKGREEVAVKALNLGADFYINKIGRPDTVYPHLSHSISQAVRKSKAEKRLIYKANFESVIYRISSRFVNPANFDEAINKSLADMGQISGASRVYIFLAQENGKMMDNTHEWCATGVNPQIDNLKNVPVEVVPWWIKQLREDKVIHVTDVFLMPPEAKTERKLLEKQDIKSVIVLPINVSGELAGFIGFDNVKKTGAWSSDDVALLQIVSELIGTTLERKQSEERYRTVFENTGTAMCVLEEDKTISLTNKKFEELSGYSQKEIVGKKWTTFVTEKFLEKMQKYHEARRKLGEKPPKTYPFEYTNKQGQTKSGFLTIELVPQTSQSVASIIDITETKKIEMQLEDSEQQFRQLFASMPSGVAVYEAINGGEDFVFKDFNDAAECIEKISQKDVIGKRVTDVFPGVKDFGLFEVLQRVYRTGLSEYVPIKFYHDSREVGWRENWVYKLPNKKVVAIFNDATEQKKSEETLKESEKKYRTLFDTTMDGVLIVDSEGKIESANQAAATILGYPSPQELLNTFMATHYVNPEDRKTLFEGLPKGGSLSNYEVKLKKKDGTPVYVKAAISIRKDSSGKLLASDAIFRDITQQRQAARVSKENEKRYQEIINGMNDTVWVIGFDGKFVDVNDAAVKLMGYSREELLSMGPTDIDNALTPEQIKGLIQGMKTNEIQVFETAHTTKDGKTFPVEISSSRVTYQGKPAILSIARDITERKRAVKKIRDSEERLRLLVENAPIAIYMNDADGRFVDGNKYAEELTGYKREELIGKNMLEVNLFLEKDFPRIIERLKANLCGEKTGPDTLELIKKDGSIIVIENVSIPVQGEGKTAVIGIARDVTERKKLEKALHDSMERFRQVTENAAEWVWEVDADGLYTFSSTVVEKLLGYKPEEIVGKKHFYDLFPHEEQEDMKKAAFSAFKEKQPFRDFVNRNVHKNGNMVWLSTSGVPIVDDQGKLVGYRGADVDITDRKKAEDVMETMVNDLAQVIEKLRIVGKAARHDVRNKISVIANNVYLARQGLTDNHNASEYLDAVDSAIGQIDKIFDFARTYEMIGVEERSYINVEKSVEEAALLFSGLGGAKLENECRGLTVLADSQLRQLFYNLIDNSIRHGETVTKIGVRCEEKEDVLKLIYEDDGVGIPENEKGLIFKEGYGKGTGYGLYLITKICESYGWTIKETGLPGKCAQFIVTINKTNNKSEIGYQLQ
jgi:PAS domain S-box-containing protein